MSYSVAQIANYFIERGTTEGVKVDPLKLQKLVYLAHGWHLFFKQSPLIDDRIEAWRYGPVVPYLYRMARQYGSGPVSSRFSEPAAVLPLNHDTENLLAQVWKTYGRKSGIDLSMLTHEPGYAWDLTRRTNETPWSDAVIENVLIEDEFRSRQTKSSG